MESQRESRGKKRNLLKKRSKVLATPYAENVGKGGPVEEDGEVSGRGT